MRHRLQPLAWLSLTLAATGLTPGCRKDTDASGRVGRVLSQWPAWPSGADRARQLVTEYTHRTTKAGARVFSPGDVLSALERGITSGRVVGGWPAIGGWLRERMDAAASRGVSSWLLWGTYHDAGAQIDSFRRLVGPAGVPGLAAVAVEAFDADGKWAGIPAEVQRGDSGTLLAWLRGGHPETLGRLRASQIRDNYTAWKYGYLEQLMDLALTARATGVRLVGCDMPAALQRRMRDWPGDSRDRLRELHCALAVQDGLAMTRPPHRVAMLWGQGHLAPAGVQRFLGEEDRVFAWYAFGGRASESALEEELGARVRLTQPLLVPLDAAGDEALVLLPVGRLKARLERKHDPPDEQLPPDALGYLSVGSTSPGVLHLGEHKLRVGADSAALKLDPGPFCYLFEADPGHLAGCHRMPADGFLELALDPARGTVEVIFHSRTR